jgi:hypothetical protein
VNEFDGFVQQVVEQIRASEARKDAMREELVWHLMAAYEEELRSSGDRAIATEAARRRFGEVEAIRQQLQAVVPWSERISAVVRKEILMRKWIWVIAWLVMIVVMMCLMPDPNFRIDLIIVGVVGGVGVMRLSQDANSVTKWLGPRWGWRAVGVLFGMAVILPALAMMKQGKRDGMEVAVPIALGTVMVLIGIVTFGDALRRRYTRSS